MQNRPNVLVVCGRNKRRSRTAEYLFKNDSRIHIRSAGLSPNSDRKISEKDIHWANLIMVMEGRQKRKLQELYPTIEIPKIEILDIPDDYAFMELELIEQLTIKINAILKTDYRI